MIIYKARGNSDVDTALLSARLAPCVQPLAEWFEAGKRRLPWREDPTPYRVWVSEIMLQQTRIEAVLPYFERFMQACPTVQDLARLDPERLMKLWEGLGYYSRARHLQKAAIQITEEYGGELPADLKALRALPGIGDYTAGAIASIAFGIPAAAVDGNVLRVLARMTACREDVMSTAVVARMTALATALVPKDRPGVFNQALMELGERVCLPNTMPRCEACPIRAWCAVGGTPLAAELPVRAKKKPRRIEKKTVLVLITKEDKPRVLLHKRPAKGLLADLWELPALEGHVKPTLPFDGLVLQSDWLPLENSRHIFSHIEWHMTAALALIAPMSVPSHYELVDADALATDRALPSAFRAYAQMLPTWLAERTDHSL